jgi:peptide/nickel transport system permease protein
MRLDRRGGVGAAILAAAVAGALAAPLVAPVDPDTQRDVVATRFLPPFTTDAHGVYHVLGTDRLGRDVWSRLVYGARVSLAVGGLAMAISLAIGIAVGAVAAAGGGLVRTLLLGATDFALGLPRVVLLLLLAALWQPSAALVIVVLGVTGWMPVARLVYAEARAQLARPYAEAARALGAGRLRLLARHALPNALAPVIALATLGVGNAITLEAGLSFLGLGVQPPAASWGTMIASGRDTVVNAPWVGLAPGIALVLVVVGCTLLADAVQERRVRSS